MTDMLKGRKPTKPGIYAYQDGAGSPVLRVRVYLEDGELMQQIEDNHRAEKLERVDEDGFWSMGPPDDDPWE